MIEFHRIGLPDYFKQSFKTELKNAKTEADQNDQRWEGNITKKYFTKPSLNLLPRRDLKRIDGQEARRINVRTLSIS